MVPATAENGDKITIQLAKIITIPAHQLAQCQLQTSTGTAGFTKTSVGATPAGISLIGSPLTVRALAPGTQVMRLAMPTHGLQQQTQQQTLVVSQPGSVGSGTAVVTVTTANQTATAQPHIISGIIKASDLVIGGRIAPAARGVGAENMKAAAVQVQAVQVPMSVQQNQTQLQTVQVQNQSQSEAADAEIGPVVIQSERSETTSAVTKAEDLEC